MAGPGCKGRGLGSHYDGLSDSGLPVDSGADPDGARLDPCAPMDAVETGDLCHDTLGYKWNGTSCEPLLCGCEGEDCDDLYPTKSGCLSQRAPACLPAPACLELGYEECLEEAGCQVVLYGGGCMNLDDCSWGGPGGDNWLCWERGLVCLPADHPCTQMPRSECEGECYWWEREQTVCFEGCCVSETYGYCAPVPGEARCRPQEIGFCPDPCETIVGYQWDGAFCRPVRCCCTGSDCDDMHMTLEECIQDRLGCMENACASAGGYCDYGDAVPPACSSGYGRDDLLMQNDPGVCGMGICCTPCPEDGDPGVFYASHSKEECEIMDWDCIYPEYTSFYNECGCGCLLI